MLGGVEWCVGNIVARSMKGEIGHVAWEGVLS